MNASEAVLRLHFRLVRRSTFVLAALFFAASFAVVAGYEGIYPAGSDRSAAVELGSNPGFRALLGSGAGLDTAGGFTAWRFGGPGVVIIAIWAYLSATRLLRGEEDAGRTELVRTGAVTPAAIVATALAVLGGATGLVVVATALGMVASGAPVDGAALTALAVGIGAAVFGSLGVLAAQLLPTRRAAALASGGVVVVAFLVRALANTKDGWAWLRWATPFGWEEIVRPFGDRTALPFAVASVVTASLSAMATRLAARRDLGSAVIPDRPSRAPRRFGLSSDLAFAGRQVFGRVALWAVPLLVLTTTFGLLSKDVGEFFRSNETFADVFERFDVDPSVPVRAFIGFVVSMFAVVGVCFAVSEVAAVREEESTGRLDNVLTRAVTRRSWLRGRLAMAAAGVGILGISLAAGGAVGVAGGGADIAVAEFATVAVNALPIGLCFLGITALVFAVAPRATTGAGFGLVALAFVWQLVGSAIRAPQWVMDLTPFAHVAPVPAQGVNVAAAVVLAGTGVACALAAVARFARRDLQEA